MSLSDKRDFFGGCSLSCSPQRRRAAGFPARVIGSAPRLGPPLACPSLGGALIRQGGGYNGKAVSKSSCVWFPGVVQQVGPWGRGLAGQAALVLARKKALPSHLLSPPLRHQSRCDICCREVARRNCGSGAEVCAHRSASRVNCLTKTVVRTRRNETAVGLLWPGIF
jgi:hypothetical protein